MRRQIAGLRTADRSVVDRAPDGVFFARVQHVQFRRHAPKPYYIVALSVVEPCRFAGNVLSSRIYCNPKALWKLSWFLRDFGYDAELLDRDEVDECRLVGLSGSGQGQPCRL